MVKIKVHRGLNQIGGCITEIWTETSRVFVDMGQNLYGCGEETTPEEDEGMVEALFAQNKKEHEAVVYTHGHNDHIGLFMYVPDGVPQYMSDGTKELTLTRYELIAQSHRMSLSKADVELTREYYEQVVEEDNRLIGKIKAIITWRRAANPDAIRVGDITITPFHCNHSIYDASMLLIEADGKRIWHTGDFRDNGFSGDLFKTLRTRATNIDTLIIEGTMLNQDKVNITEREVSDKMAHVMQAFNYVFVLCSATDIDRLAAVNRACQLAGKRLYVCSRFMQTTMQIFTRREGRKPSLSHLFTRKGRNWRLYHFTTRFHNKPVPSAQMVKEGFVMALSASAYHIARQLRDALDPSETLLVYSNWDGYYKIPEQVEHAPAYSNFRKLFPNVVDIHTSGHADRPTLRRVIETINPKEIIAIHKDKDASIDSLLST